MDIKICCEWCGKVMKSVKTFEAVRDAQQKNDTICKGCAKKVNAFERFLTREREEYKKSLDDLTKYFRNEFRKKITKGDFDGENIQDVGSENQAS